MTCYRLHDKNGKPSGFLCGELGEPCAICGDVSSRLCDYPVGDGKTCDRAICDRHAGNVAHEVDYCPGHYAEWKAWRDGGGLQKALSEQFSVVLPFRPRHVKPPESMGADDAAQADASVALKLKRLRMHLRHIIHHEPEQVAKALPAMSVDDIKKLQDWVLDTPLKF